MNILEIVTISLRLYIFQNAYEIDRGYSQAQSILTKVILTVSIIGLMLTLMFMMPYRALRTERSVKINICLTAALLLASLTFLIQDLIIKSDNTGVIKLVGPQKIYMKINNIL